MSPAFDDYLVPTDPGLGPVPGGAQSVSWFETEIRGPAPNNRMAIVAGLAITESPGIDYFGPGDGVFQIDTGYALEDGDATHGPVWGSAVAALGAVRGESSSGFSGWLESVQARFEQSLNEPNRLYLRVLANIDGDLAVNRIAYHAVVIFSSNRAPARSGP